MTKFFETTPSGESQLLKDEEIMVLIMAVSRAKKDDGFDEEDVMKVIRWAERIRLETTMLDLVIKQQLLVHFDEDQDDFVFQNPDKCQE